MFFVTIACRNCGQDEDSYLLTGEQILNLPYVFMLSISTIEPVASERLLREWGIA